jgi:hypothetical protein
MFVAAAAAVVAVATVAQLRCTGRERQLSIQPEPEPEPEPLNKMNPIGAKAVSGGALRVPVRRYRYLQRYGRTRTLCAKSVIFRARHKNQGTSVSV